MKKDNNNIAVLIIVIFLLLSILSEYVGNSIFSIVLPLTIMGMAIAYNPYSIGMVLLVIVTSIGYTPPYDYTDGMLYLSTMAIVLVVIDKFIDPMIKKYNISTGVGYIVLFTVYFYLTFSSPKYLPAVIKTLHSFL